MSAIDASIDLRDGTRVLDSVNLDVRPGELLAIVGASGSGKSTLLETLAGLRAPTSGRITVGEQSVPLGYVPQDDIVHRDLSVESTVRYAARLRLPSGTPRAEVDLAVDRTLETLGLTDRRRLTVGALSGGQRKRVSIATELVIQPDVCFLDEPTAGLDPISAAALIDTLRSLADSGTAVVMTTHNLADLRGADRLIVMAAGGRIDFDGAPADGAAHLGSSHDHERRLAPAVIGRPGVRRAEESVTNVGPADGRRPVPARRPGFEQVLVLARRNVELTLRNRTSLAIMAGSPLLVVAMFAILFPPNAFDPSADRTAAIAVVYWLAFAGFFFGLTFGLLQICTEFPIVRRERLVTIDLGPYLVAKAAVLVPILGAVNLVMMVTLSRLDRLPALGPRDALTVWAVLGLDALAGLALGLVASASVASAAQAALALPMLCFPAVLFSGAVLPVTSMTGVGRGIAAFMSDRWAFEALARSLHIGDAPSGSAGQRAIDLHGGALSGPIGVHALVMVGLAVAFGLAARVVLDRRAR